MSTAPAKLTLQDWDAHHANLVRGGLREPSYGGPLSRHVAEQDDFRLGQLRFDNSPAALRLWNFVLTENERLARARVQGDCLVGAMKDLGTVPVIAYSFPRVRAFYPDGAWWTPCLMECSDGLLREAERLGLDSSFCPVRAMVPAFLNQEHFPIPDLLLCSTGAVCDDFSAIAQRLEHLGHRIVWWEMPRRRLPGPGEESVQLPGGAPAPRLQVDCARAELERIAGLLTELAGTTLTAELLANGIRHANRVRALIRELRRLSYLSPGPPLPALEMLLIEILSLHFCSDREECLEVVSGMLAEVKDRTSRSAYTLSPDAVRVYWINPPADLRILNWLEDWGGRICGSDYMFSHALDPIPTDLPPFEALARTALADPMTGAATDRARRIITDCKTAEAEAVVFCRIPGASHCAWEGPVLRETVTRELEIPFIELEVPPICDPMLPTLASRVQAALESARSRRPDG